MQGCNQTMLIDFVQAVHFLGEALARSIGHEQGHVPLAGLIIMFVVRHVHRFAVFGWAFSNLCMLCFV